MSLPDLSTTSHRTSAPALVSVTTPIDDPGDLLALLPAGLPAAQVFSWVRRGEGMVGWGHAASCDTSGDRRFRDAQDWWREVCLTATVEDDVALPGTGLVGFGSMAYSPRSPAGGRLVVPAVIVGRRDGRAWLTRVRRTGQPFAAPVGGGGASVTPLGAGVAGAAGTAGAAPVAPRDLRFSDGAMSGPDYMGAVAAAVQRIAAGELDKVVLARDVVATGASALDPRWLLRRLADGYPNTWVFSVDGLLGATPEMLVRLEKHLVTSRVLAGTIRRTGDDDKDLALAGSLARSSKDLEEHEYAVASVAEALAPHCSSINVPESPFVLHLPNVMHLATDVAGVLSAQSTSLALAEALHPSAAVCGTPKIAADELIAELEHMDRGRYAGPVGWLSADGDGEWGIGLRSGAISPTNPAQITLYAGCGIVAGSDPEAELSESDAKLVPMRDSLGS